MSLDDHLRDIARAPMLTCDEEIMLGNSVQEMIKTLEENGLDGQISQSNIATFVKKSPCSYSAGECLLGAFDSVARQCSSDTTAAGEFGICHRDEGICE